MQTNRLKLTCAITRRTVTASRGVESESDSTLFSAVPCYVAKPDFSLRASTVERSENSDAKIVVPLSVTGIVPGDVVTLSDGRKFMVQGMKRNEAFVQGNVELHSKLL